MILQTCPFCGDKKQLTDEAMYPRVAGRPKHWVNCGACGATGPERDDLHDAEHAWNDRAPVQKDMFT